MFRTNFFMLKIIRLLDISICLLPFGFSTILYPELLQDVQIILY